MYIKLKFLIFYIKLYFIFTLANFRDKLQNDVFDKKKKKFSHTTNIFYRKCRW